MPLLVGSPEYTKTVRDDQQAIVDLYLEKLATTFERVSPTTRWFRNSRNSPLFAMMFAATNPKGAEIAVRIANHLLKSW